LEAINGLDPDELLAPADARGWTGKDIIAHVTAWENLLSHWLESAVSGVEPQIAMFPYPSEHAADPYSQSEHEKNIALSLQEVIENIPMMYERVLAQIHEFATDENLGNRLAYGWATGDPLWTVIANHTYFHYDQHAQTLHEVSIDSQSR
jgi:hypothetical protein